MLPDLKITNFQQTFQVLVLFLNIKKLKTKKGTFLKNWKIYFDHGVDLAFGSGEFRRILDANVDDKIKIMPHAVPDVGCDPQS